MSNNLKKFEGFNIKLLKKFEKYFSIKFLYSLKKSFPFKNK